MHIHKWIFQNICEQVKFSFQNSYLEFLALYETFLPNFSLLFAILKGTSQLERHH